MSALTSFFFRSPTVAPSTWSVVQWWETRRAVYNAAVGTTGLLSLAAVAVFDWLPPSGHIGLPPLALVLVYGVMANICYSLGPLVDSLICRRWGHQFEAVGPTIFRYGFVFSIGLTLLPVPAAALGWVGRLLFAQSA